MSRHLLAGGVLLVEPWFTPEQWYAGRVSTVTHDAEGVDGRGLYIGTKTAE